MSQLDLGPELDWTPVHMRRSAWLEHVPFAFWLVARLQPGLFVDIGIDIDVSYAAICHAVERLGLSAHGYGVDAAATAADAGRSESAASLEFSRLHDLHWSGFSTLIRSSVGAARAHFADCDVDLLHIGSLQDRGGLATCFDDWRATLSNRGVVLFHGTTDKRDNLEVWKLWRELADGHPHFEFPHGRGLGVLAIGEDLPMPLRVLTTLSHDGPRARFVRELFAARGRSLCERQKMVESEARIRDVTGQVAIARREADLWRQETSRSLRERDQQAAARRCFEARVAEQADLSYRLVRAQAQLAELRDHQATLLAHAQAAEASKKALQADYAAASATIAALVNSSSWKVTRPVRAAVRLLRGEPIRNGLSSATHMPCATDEAAQPIDRPHFQARALATEPAVDVGKTARELLLGRAAHLSPLATFFEPDAPRRLTMVTDSISSGNLLGGVGTAIILAALLARRLGVMLRVVTRNDAPAAANIGTLLRLHGVSDPGDIECLHAGYDQPTRAIPVGQHDLFLTTSWWSTWATMRSVDPARIVYLVQEDERLFYPAGDEQLLCSEVLADARLRFVVNTTVLREHLAGTGLPGITERSVAFEPAFPTSLYHRESRGTEMPRRLVFYARPNHPRNLFLRGIEVLSRAIERRVLDPADWEFWLLGTQLPRAALDPAARVHYVQGLGWQDYAALIRRADIGLSLMYTPHPSYPPLDLAASGAVVVTNRFGVKESLSRYCANILCVEPATDALVEGLSQAVRLVADDERRDANARAAQIGRDWGEAFAPALDRLLFEHKVG